MTTYVNVDLSRLF